MRILGITGGVASGKSFVAEGFAKLGAGVLDADRAGHEALRMPQVEAAARQRWGEAIFGPDGHIDRARLAKIVFAPGKESEQERKFLEGLTHPEIARRLRQQIEALKKTGVEAAVLDAALLTEAGWDEWCDTIVFVDAPRATRLSRALTRGWTKGEFDARENAQDALQHKRERADVVIDNSGPPEQTQRQVERIWKLLKT